MTIIANTDETSVVMKKTHTCTDKNNTDVSYVLDSKEEELEEPFLEEANKLQLILKKFTRKYKARS